MSHRLRVLIIGHDAVGGGGWCYAQALVRGGHDVVHVSDWAGLEKYAISIPLRVFRRLTGGVREADRKRHVARVMAVAEQHRPNVVMALGGRHLAADDVRRLQRLGGWVANVCHDDLFSRNRYNTTPSQRSALPVYDRLLVTREVNVAEVAPLNPRVEFFPFAYEPSIHRPISIPPGEAERWGVDVVFVGTYAPHRAAMLEWLVAAVPARYAVHGNSWEKLGSRSPLRPFVTFADVKLDDQAKALGGAKIALGFLRKENRDEYTQRTFEIPACGGLMLAERTAAHLALFREGEEAEFFDPDDPAELIAKVQDLLADPVRRERVRAGGMAALTRCDHTYDDRVRRLLAAYHRDAPALTSA